MTTTLPFPRGSSFSRSTVVVVVVALASGLACSRGGSGAKGAAGRPSGVVLATVNGVAITDADLGAEKRAQRIEAELSPQEERAIVEHIVSNELVAQKAEELGLDQDPPYREELNRRLAEVANWRRQTLRGALFQKEVASKVQVTDLEALQFFEQNAASIRAEVHLMQVVARSEAEIVNARSQIESGADFEEVAKARYRGGASEEARPWDLGYVHWKQIPEQWRAVVAQLKPGQTSEVIRGPGRFWILKLIDRRETAADFEQVKPIILDELRGRKTEERRSSVVSEIEKAAKVEYAKGTQARP